MVNPPILTTIDEFQGKHNLQIQEEISRLRLSKSSKDLSTICIIPHSGMIPAKAAQNWFNLTAGMNQKFLPLMINGTDKNLVFNNTIVQILSNPMLNSCKFILLMDENIVPPFDGLWKLFENTDKFDVIGGLMWQTGIEKVHAMIYGNPGSMPLNFLPIPPEKDTIMQCCGVSMGFTLFKIDIFKDTRIPFPWFRTKTISEPKLKKNPIPDMYFFENIGKLGYKAACDTRIRVGHYDVETDIIW